MKSTSYEIIDPSLNVMVDKSSDHAAILNENKDLKQWNSIIIISSVFIIGIALILTLNQKRDTKED
ncbi:MAG: hypothetical protein GYB35_14890 [Algicola sp.]|nr:hypothetical protein [Algicola sp.]